jgi:hypothetical protein
MLDFIFTIGQAGCALLLLYGAALVLMPARRTPNPAAEDQFVVRSHMLYDV